MAYPALASTDDFEMVTGAMPDEFRVSRLLEMASAAVRRYTGQVISTVAGDVALVPAFGAFAVVLPQRPVTAVSAVTIDGVTQLPADYNWTRSGALTTDLNTWGNLPLTVTYDHGYTEIPDDIVQVVCSVANRAVVNPSGIRSETVGGYSVVHTIPATGMTLTRAEQQALESYRRPGRSVWMSP